MRFVWPLLSLILCAPVPAVAQTAPRGTPIEIVRTAQINLGVDTGDPDLEFDRIETPFLLPNGHVVVPTSGDNSIRVFRPNGQLVTTYGRKGSGPGEFRYLTGAWARGDTIEAIDAGIKRITRFHPNGTVEVVTLQTQMHDHSFGAGPLPDGWYLGGVADGQHRWGSRDQVTLHRFNRAGVDLGEVARVEGFLRYRMPHISGPGPLSPRPIFSTNNGRGYVAESLTPRIQVFNASGQREREIRWTPERSPPVRDALRLVIDSAVARAKPQEAVRLRQSLESAPAPQQLSVFAKFIVDDQGFIWMRPFEPLLHAAALGGLSSAGPGGLWTILSPAGVKIGTVKVPDDLELMQITSNAVVGIARDELGVESVRVHELKRK